MRAEQRVDLVDAVVALVEVPRDTAETVIEVILDSIIDALRTGQAVSIRSFGVFGVRSRKARIGRNPKTGARIEVPAKLVAFFKACPDVNRLLASR
jgi:integration host factor subunit beta